MKVADAAQQSATEMLQAMFSTNGYRVEITYR
jgi:hypothetical protein